MANKDQPRRVGLRPFAEIVGELAQGDVERALTTQLAELVRACDATKKKGVMTIKLNVNPGPKMMTMTADIVTKIPKPPIEATAFYTDDKGSLSIENPRQTNMGFGRPELVNAPTKPDGEN